MTRLNSLLSTERYAEDEIEGALRAAGTAWKVFSALRAESDERFIEGARAYLADGHAAGLRGVQWSSLAHTRIEGHIGVLEERPCDHAAGADLSALSLAIPDCSPEDLGDLLLASEFGDAAAIQRVGARLALAEPGALPTELHADPVAVKRLYRAIRARFDHADPELAYLCEATGTRLLAGGAAVIIEAQGQEWPEVIPTHGRGATNASRALVNAIVALGQEAMTTWLKPALSHIRTKGRVACAGLPWDERFDGAGAGQAVRVRRHSTFVMTEVGKAHPKVAVLPSRPRRSIKVHKKQEKARADFAKKVASLSDKHQLRPVAAEELTAQLETLAQTIPSDVPVALVELGVPLPDLFWFRGDPEVTRRAIVHGADVDAPAPDGKALLDHAGVYFWDLQRTEQLTAAGARLQTSERLEAACKAGEYRLGKLLVHAGAPVTPSIIEAARPWPRLHRFLQNDPRRGA